MTYTIQQAEKDLRDLITEQWEEMNEDERPCDELEEYLDDAMEWLPQDLWESEEWGEDIPPTNSIAYSAGVYLGYIV